MIRSPILSSRVWCAVASCGAAIIGFGALTRVVVEVEKWEFADWLLISAIFTWNATIASCCFSRGGSGWIRLAILPLAVLCGAAASCLIDDDLWEPILPMLSIQALLVWLFAIATGFPRWRTADVDDDVRPRYTIMSMMVLTFAAAGLFVAARVGDLGSITLPAMIVFMTAAVGGWVLGCTTFCFNSKRARLAGFLFLPVLCCVLWLAIPWTIVVPSNNEEILQISITMPCTQFAITSFIGFFSFGDESLQREPLDSVRSESTNRPLV